MNLIITEPEQLQSLITQAVQTAVRSLPQIPREPEKNLHSIQELADFLGCSTVKAQQLKNSGQIRFYQSGRKCLFRPDEILEDIAANKRRK